MEQTSVPFPLDRLTSLGASTAQVVHARREWRVMTDEERGAESARILGMPDRQLEAEIADDRRRVPSPGDVPANGGEVVGWVGRSVERARVALSVEESRAVRRPYVLTRLRKVLS